MDSDEVDGVKWDAWNRTLASIAGIVAVGGRRDDNALGKLYEVAVELREKLRYSQGRLRSVKQELGVTLAAARSERHEARARLQELETEVARLAGAVQAQGSTLAARETVSQSQAAENDQLRRHVAAVERQLQRAEEDRKVTVSERNDALRHLEKMTQLLEDSERRVTEVQTEHNTLLGELVVTKGRLADMSALETLYGAARDELERLDRENGELKDMVAGGGVQLGRSRLLEALGIPESGSRKGAAAAVGTGSSGPLGRSRSAPRARRSSLVVGKSGSGLFGSGEGAGGAMVDLSSYKNLARPYSARGTSPGRDGLNSGASTALSPPRQRSSPAPAGGGGAPWLDDCVSEMAFLGPPSSAYPPDPENYVFYRVGGGYTAKVNPTQPTIPQTRASGWVPKDVVRLVQAFRHSYGLTLEWRFWEPLMLMIDEVYRTRADGTMAALRAAQQDKIRAVRRQVHAALCYPSALATGKIHHLQRQLQSARKVLALGDRKSEMPLKQMALKDYQLGAQLDRAVEENFALRRSLEDLEELVQTTLVDGKQTPTTSGHATTETTSAGGGVGGGGVEGGVRRPAAYDYFPPTSGGANSPRVHGDVPRLSPRRLQQHQQHHMHRSHRHRYGGMGGGGGGGLASGMELEEEPIRMSRSGGRGVLGVGGGNHHKSSELGNSRRTSMMSGMHGGGGMDTTTDALSMLS